MSKKTDLWDRLKTEKKIVNNVTSGCNTISDGMDYDSVTIKMIEEELASSPVPESKPQESVVSNQKTFVPPPLDEVKSKREGYKPDAIATPINHRKPRQPVEEVIIEEPEIVIKGNYLGRVERFASDGRNDISVMLLQEYEGEIYVGNQKVVEKFVTANGYVGYVTGNGFQWRQIKG